MSIKGILREELEYSLEMQKNYERELAKLPKGSLVRRMIRGRAYYYLIFREAGQFRSKYRGKVSAEEIEKYRHSKEFRAKYRHLLSRVKKEIRFMRSALRGKEQV